jgi:hypothetical protein
MATEVQRVFIAAGGYCLKRVFQSGSGMVENGKRDSVEEKGHLYKGQGVVASATFHLAFDASRWQDASIVTK